MGFPTDLKAREAYILEAVQSGNYSVEWVPLQSTANGHTALFHVTADALKVDGIRVNVSASLQQKIADMLGAMLLTPKLADLMWLHADVVIDPRPRTITSSTEAMIQHSQEIDAALEKINGGPLPAGLLVGTVGKHWCIDQKLAGKSTTALNYGWHFRGASFQGIKGEPVASLVKDPKTGQYYRLIQGEGTAHDYAHVDYSQTCMLVSRACEVDGQPTSLVNLLQDKALASLASHQGAMTVLRQPGVPEPDDHTLVMPTTTIVRTLPPPDRNS